MRSLQVYSDSSDSREKISVLPEDLVVKGLIEPLSNRQRFQILKSLASEAMTFSALSSLTGLRGGNLLFHLQKLLDGGMAVQSRERGEYLITEKGYAILKGIAEVYSSLIPTMPSKTNIKDP